MDKNETGEEGPVVEELAGIPKKLQCNSCNEDINKQPILKVDNDVYHEVCVRCTDCKKELKEKCFKRDSRLLCETDYRRRYSPRCFLCSEPVFPKTPIRHIQDQVCHLTCVRCIPCNRELHTGEKCRLNHDNKLECLKDHSICMSVFQGINLAMDYTPFARKSRTIIYPHQYEELKCAYISNSKPTKRSREALALKTGLDTKVVQVWFQNQRAKWKRLVLKRTGKLSSHCILPAQNGGYLAIAETESLTFSFPMLIESDTL